MKQNSKKRIDKRMIVPFCVCVLLLVVLAVAIIWSAFTDIDLIAQRYADALLQNDADAIYSMYAPGAISYVSRETELSERELKSNLRTKMSLWAKKELTREIGVLSKTETSIISKEDVPEETVRELETNFGVKAQSAKCLTVSYHAEGEKGSKDGEMTVYVVKIDGEWYLYDLQMLLG